MQDFEEGAAAYQRGDYETAFKDLNLLRSRGTHGHSFTSGGFIIMVGAFLGLRRSF